MRRLFLFFAAVLGPLLLTALPLQADVKLPALFCDNMVLQREISAPVYGTAEPGESVTVALGRSVSSRNNPTTEPQFIPLDTETTTTGPDGRWVVKLKPQKAGGPFTLSIAGKNTLMVHNVLFGDVWICAGQSNMEFSVANRGSYKRGVLHEAEEIASANHPQLRLFIVKQGVAEQPQTDTTGHWQECSPTSVGDFSAVGYFFGRDVQQSIHVPIGLIEAATGGVPSEAFTSRPTLEADPEFKALIDNWNTQVAVLPQAKEKYQADVKVWEAASKAANAAGQPAPPYPHIPLGWIYTMEPAGLYNAMISPLTLYAIKGVIWYQGETNADRAYQYRRLFPALIKDWRQAWGQGDFPFLFVQLPNFAVPVQSDQHCWAELREAQQMALAVPNTGMAVTIDLGEADNIHPKDKQDVGERLARVALARVYGKNVVYEGPTYDHFTVQGSNIRIYFKPDGNLMARGGEPLKGFVIAGADQKFVAAEARIDGKTVVVSSPGVPKPVAVRYAFEDNPVCNLYNKTGLPASPFRTDDWPGLTVDRHLQQ